MQFLELDLNCINFKNTKLKHKTKTKNETIQTKLIKSMIEYMN